MKTITQLNREEIIAILEREFPNKIISLDVKYDWTYTGNQIDGYDTNLVIKDIIAHIE